MQWHEVIEHPSLQNLPFKIELNQFGKILMSPASNYHGRLQMQIGQKLARYLPHGEVIAECSIQTDDNVKVADLVWASNAFIQDYAYKTPYPKAPEICIEIISPSNSQQEMQQKIKLYLDRGALEVWIIHENKTIDIYSSLGKIEQSQLIDNWTEITI
jgi:Uma2 family endonuclease